VHYVQSDKRNRLSDRLYGSSKQLHDVIVLNKKNTAEPAIGMAVGFSDHLAQIFSIILENVTECTVKFRQHILFYVA